MYQFENKPFKIIASAVLFILLILNIYYISPSQNKFIEPWDFIFSVVTPIILTCLAAFALPIKEPKNTSILKNYMTIILMGLIIYGNHYLSHNYWNKLSGFWSFILIGVLPLTLIIILIKSPLLKNNQNNVKTKN